MFLSFPFVNLGLVFKVIFGVIFQLQLSFFYYQSSFSIRCLVELSFCSNLWKFEVLAASSTAFNFLSGTSGKCALEIKLTLILLVLSERYCLFDKSSTIRYHMLERTSIT